LKRLHDYFEGVKIGNLDDLFTSDSTNLLKEVILSPDKRPQTGFSFIDNYYENDMGFLLIGAPVGSGKSTLLSQIALNLVKNGKKVLYIDAELGVKHFLSRILKNLKSKYNLISLEEPKDFLEDLIRHLAYHQGQEPDENFFKAGKYQDRFIVRFGNFYYVSLSANLNLLLDVILLGVKAGIQHFIVDYLDNFTDSIDYKDIFHALKLFEDIILQKRILVINGTQVKHILRGSVTALDEASVFESKYSRAKEEKAWFIFYWMMKPMATLKEVILPGVIKKNRCGKTGVEAYLKFDFENFTVEEIASYETGQESAAEKPEIVFNPEFAKLIKEEEEEGGISDIVKVLREVEEKEKEEDENEEYKKAFEFVKQLEMEIQKEVDEDEIFD